MQKAMQAQHASVLSVCTVPPLEFNKKKVQKKSATNTQTRINTYAHNKKRLFEKKEKRKKKEYLINVFICLELKKYYLHDCL